MSSAVNAEFAVLGAPFIDPAVVDKLAEIVTPGDFEDPQRAEVWASIVELADGRNGISAVTVASHIMSRRTGSLRRGLLESDQDVLEFVLAAGDNVLTAVGSEWHAAMVAGAAKLRRFQTEATKVAAASAGADPAEAMRFIEASLDRMSAPFEATRQQADISGKSVLKALSERVQLVCRGQQGPRGPTTQLADLDNIVAEMQPGKTWILGGNSGHGKTAFTCHLAQAACKQNTRTLIVSLADVDAEQIMARMVASEARLPYGKIERGHLTLDEQATFVFGARRAFQWVDNLDIWRASSATVAQIARRVRAARRSGRPYGVVIIDYGQKLKSTQRHANREQAVAEVADSATEMFIDEQVCGVVPLQFNRENQKRPGGRPAISDLRESAQWEHNADVGLLLFRPCKFDDSAPANIAHIIVAKNRGGTPGEAKVLYEPAENRWDTLTAREYP